MPNGRLKKPPGVMDTTTPLERTGTLNGPKPVMKVAGSRQTTGSSAPKGPRLDSKGIQEYGRAIDMGMRSWNTQPGRIDYMWGRPEIQANPELQKAFMQNHLQHLGKPYVPLAKRKKR